MGDMDSGNSGSLQSSSTGGGGGGGDDQEFDSCRCGGTESISAFLNSCNNINMDNIGAAQLYSFSNNGSSSSSFAAHNMHQVSNFFSSLEYPNLNIDNNTNNNHNNSRSNSNSNNQLDIVWPNKFPSIRGSISTNDTNCTTEGPPAYTITNNHQRQSSTSLALPARLGPGKNPKKRSRASRRAPTTVLTTDTTNFRQMVQEFTGIPAPPFTSFSTRTRFDLFAGLGGHSCNNSNVVQPPSYLLGHFPQKIAPLYQPQFLGTSISTNSNDNNAIGVNINNTNSIIMNDGLGPAAVFSNTAASTCTTLSPTTFHLCDTQDYVSSTNPQLNFQSFIHPSVSASATVSASALALNDSKYLLPALVQQDSSMSMGCTSVSSSTAQISCSVNNPAGESGSYLGTSNTNTNTTSVATNGALENIGGVTKGGEGMVDSWICSSD